MNGPWLHRIQTGGVPHSSQQYADCAFQARLFGSSLLARPKAERVFAEYENFLNLSDPTDPTGTLFSVLYLLNQTTDWKMVFAI